MLPSYTQLNKRLFQQEIWKNPSITSYIVSSEMNILDALKKIKSNKYTFLLSVNEYGKLNGALDSSDIHECLIEYQNLETSIGEIPIHEVKTINTSDSFDVVIDMFQNQGAEYLAVVDNDYVLSNIITKYHFHLLLLEDIAWDFRFDFFSLDEGKLLQDVVNRPWGFYKSLFISDFTQVKVISLLPGQEISLQKHFKREEYWTIVRGKGIMTVDDQSYFVEKGRQIFIPKEAIHRIRNTQAAGNLVLIEAQLGDYFGEDDIVRLRDKYGRE